MNQPLRLAAPAKLNLYLHVVGRRQDGYHLLDGLIAFADIHDTLTLAPASSLGFDAEGPFAQELGGGEFNLVVRAAIALAAAVDREPAVSMCLEKRLPVASGIGGGSADAAACLRGLALLWSIDPKDAVIRRVAELLGADVPVCVDGRAVFIGGIGADFTPAPRLPPVWLVLVNPGIPLPTPEVYRARQGGFSKPARFDETPSGAAGLASVLALRSNDLTPAAIGLAPEIADLLAVLDRTEGCLLARMSGSGATCFGLYGERRTAERAASAIRQNHAGWWVAAGRLLEDTEALIPT